jgi:hypothetical protein
MTKEEISQYIEEARRILAKIDATSSDKNVTKNVKDAIQSNASDIQNILNNLIGSSFITDDDISRLNEEVGKAKRNLLRAKTLKSTKKLLIIGGASLLVIGFLWYLTSNKFVK